MIIALVNKTLVNAINVESGTIGECPHCGTPVIAKCGEIKIHHWAHINNECPYITEPDTEWHAAWKHKFEKKGYLTEQKFDNFIADSYNPKTNTVVEFQHSSITPQEIKDRCNYYRSKGIKIVWIFDYTEKYLKRHIELIEIFSNNEYRYEFGIKWQKKSYLQGVTSKDLREIYVPIYFNIICNYDSKPYTQLRVIKDFDEYKKEVDLFKINRYRNYNDNLNNSIYKSTFYGKLSMYHSNKVLAELNYNINNSVLLEPKSMDYVSGESGWGNLIFM